MNVKSTILNSLDTSSLDRTKTTIVCTSNERYIPILNACLNSIKYNCNNVNVVVRLVNINDDTYNNITSDHSNICFMRELIIASACRNIINDTASGLGWKQLIKKARNKIDHVGMHEFHSQEAAYCSNIKFNTMNTLINDNFECVVYLDADTLIINNISHIKEQMSGYDIGMYIHDLEIGKYKTYHQQEYSGWHAGFMVATNTDTCKQMYSEIEAKVNENIYDIEADEDEFEAVYSTYCDDVRLRLFDIQYKDSGPDFSEDSYMWTGQGATKSCNEQYIREYKRYREM